MRFLFILYSLVLFCLVGASTPLNFSLSYHGGYDDNVMRFSSQEIENVASDVNYMGGAKKLDSYINRFQINTSKTLLRSGSKELHSVLWLVFLITFITLIKIIGLVASH